jgi:hypothetical protein
VFPSEPKFSIETSIFFTEGGFSKGALGRPLGR